MSSSRVILAMTSRLRHDGAVPIYRARRGVAFSETERRDILERRPGMYRDHWEIVDHLGGRKYAGIRAACRGAAGYLADNSDNPVFAREGMGMLVGALFEPVE